MNQRTRAKSGIGAFFLTTIAVGWPFLLVAMRGGVIGPCPNPADWVSDTLETVLLLGILGAPLVGLVVAIRVAGRRDAEVS